MLKKWFKTFDRVIIIINFFKNFKYILSHYVQTYEQFQKSKLQNENDKNSWYNWLTNNIPKFVKNCGWYWRENYESF